MPDGGVMEQRLWPESLRDDIDRARFMQGTDDWFESAKAVVQSLPEEKRDHLAALGLAELVTWVHNIDRDSAEPCMGELAARERHPELFPERDEA
jgi:hypothetical protein